MYNVILSCRVLQWGYLVLLVKRNIQAVSNETYLGETNSAVQALLICICPNGDVIGARDMPAVLPYNSI